MYTYQGKAYDSLTRWHDFHARQFDAALGRWFAVDPQEPKCPCTARASWAPATRSRTAQPYMEMACDPITGRQLFPDVGFEHVQFTGPVPVQHDGYVYIWLSNESENTKVWFDDLRVTHTQTIVTRATDYGVWGDVLREMKSDEITYRYGYQGQFAEKDEETGWNHFELREYDAVIGRWLVPDPYGQEWSPYAAMGNDPINNVDEDGGLFKRPQGIVEPQNWWQRFKNNLLGYGFLNDAYKYSQQGFEVIYEGPANNPYGAYVKWEKYEYLLTSEDETQFAWIHDASEYEYIGGYSPPEPSVDFQVGSVTGPAKNIAINYLRRKAVAIAWKQEAALVKSLGRGSTQWTRKEMVELLQTGKVKDYVGHHIKSVAKYPQHAGNPNNIQFLKKNGQHLKVHGGNFRNSTTGKFINRSKMIKGQ